MVILSVLHLPVLILNTFGTDTKTLSAAMTTFGNLGSAMNATVVTIPGCDETEFQFEHCKIGKCYCCLCRHYFLKEKRAYG